MTRLPAVGGDNGKWGEILNDYLNQSHNNDGTLRADSVGAPQLQPNSVTTASIVDGNVTTAKLADGAVSATKMSGLGQPDGVATLDSSSLIPVAQIPLSAIASSAELLAANADGIVGTPNSGVTLQQAVDARIKALAPIYAPAPSGGDDTTTLNGLLAAGGLVILRPYSSYRTSNTLTWDPSTTAVQGYQSRIIYDGNGIALKIQGSQAALRAGAALNTSEWRGIELQGPGSASTATAVSVIGSGMPGTTVNLNFRDSSIHGFGLAVGESSFAWTVTFEGLLAWNNGICIKDSIITTGGERMLYLNCNLSNNGTLVTGIGNGTSAGAQAEHVFIGCSLDFNSVLAVVFNGNVTMTDCHIEYASSTVSPVQLASSYSVFRMNGGVWVTHTDFGLAAALAARTAITSIPVSITSDQPAVAAGDTIVVTTGPDGVHDTFTASGSVSEGAIPVISAAPVNAYPAGAKVLNTSQIPVTVVAAPASMSNGAAAYFDKVPMQGVCASFAFGPGGAVNYAHFVNPNMASPNYCLTATGSTLSMGSALPTRLDSSGVFYTTAKTQTISGGGSVTLTPAGQSMIYLTVTTTAAWSLQFGAGASPPQFRTQEMDIIIYNNSGAALGALTLPGSWQNDTGATWMNPAPGKRRRMTLKFMPATGFWLITSMSSVDF